MLTTVQSEKLSQMMSKVGDLGFKRRVETMLRWLNIQPGDRILDCGCGEGFYSMVISALYDDVEVVAFDYNAELLRMAAGWVKDNKKVVFQNGNIESGLPFPNESFNKIIFTEVLEHLDDDRKALGEVYRVLKLGGVVGLTVPNKNYPFLWDPVNGTREGLGLGHFDAKNTVTGGVWAYDHKRLYGVDQISKLSQDTGFNILEKVNLTHYCLPFNYLILRLGKLFSTTSLAPANLKLATEKFQWKDGTPPRQSWYMKLVYSVFELMKKVDSRNDNVMNDVSKSSISIGLQLHKPKRAGG